MLPEGAALRARQLASPLHRLPAHDGRGAVWHARPRDRGHRGVRDAPGHGRRPSGGRPRVQGRHLWLAPRLHLARNDAHRPHPPAGAEGRRRCQQAAKRHRHLAVPSPCQRRGARADRAGLRLRQSWRSTGGGVPTASMGHGGARNADYWQPRRPSAAARLGCGHWRAGRRCDHRSAGLTRVARAGGDPPLRRSALQLSRRDVHIQVRLYACDHG
mmetsp:Transcript_58128/g.180349  ORF Transcript_58128/g.180349 Transcript_58128/m.180349 type:complete len:215 (+) Transcript_58128:1031-1675(+)